MGNRILKESICTSDTIDQLTPLEEATFYRLLVNCDDYGRMDGRTQVLKARLYPLKDIRLEQLCTVINRLASVGLATLYEVDGKPFIQIVSWDRHQRVRNQKSRYPEPVASNCTQLKSIENNCNQPQSIAVPIQSNPIRIQSESESNSTPPISPKGGPGRASKTKNENPLFDLFWKEYPRKTNKAGALKSFTRLAPGGELLAQMLSALKKQKASRQWTKDNGEFIPHPATWLNQERWNDEVGRAHEEEDSLDGYILA